MATATKNKPKKSTKKPASGKPRRRITPKRAAKASANGAAKTGNAPSEKFAPNQKPLETMEDVNERHGDLDAECERYFSAVSDKDDAMEVAEKALGKIGDLLHKHELKSYPMHGKKFFIEPGRETVKVKKLPKK